VRQAIDDVGLLRRALLGPALRLGSLPVPDFRIPSRRRDAVVPATAAVLLALTIGAGLLRDAYTSAHAELAAPSWLLPFGADVSGRDLLGRLGHGAVIPLGTAPAVVLVCLVLGILVGLFLHASVGPLEVTNAAPPILVGIVATALWSPSIGGAAIAVALVSWAPLAAHTGALVLEATAQPHSGILPVLGVGPTRILLRYLAPAVIGPIFRHSMLRLPGIALTPGGACPGKRAGVGGRTRRFACGVQLVVHPEHTHLTHCGSGARARERLALSGFQTRVLLVDHEHPAPAVHDLGAWEFLQCLERIANLHGSSFLTSFLIENEYQLEYSHDAFPFFHREPGQRTLRRGQNLDCPGQRGHHG